MQRKRETMSNYAYLFFFKKKTRKRSLWHLSLSSIKPNEKKTSQFWTGRKKKREKKKNTHNFEWSDFYTTIHIYIFKREMFLFLCVLFEKCVHRPNKKRFRWKQIDSIMCVLYAQSLSQSTHLDDSRSLWQFSHRYTITSSSTITAINV